MPSLLFFSVFLLILLHFFYFCQHMVSQLSLSSLPPSYLPSSLSVFAIIFMFEIELSYLPAHTHAHCVTPLLRNAHLISTLHPRPSLLLSSMLPHLLTYSFMLGPLSSPLFYPPLSLSFPLILSALTLQEFFPLILLPCVTTDTKSE